MTSELRKLNKSIRVLQSDLITALVYKKSFHGKFEQLEQLYIERYKLKNNGEVL